MMIITNANLVINNFVDAEKLLSVDFLPIELWYCILSFITVIHFHILAFGRTCRYLLEICGEHPKIADVRKYGPHIMDFKLWDGCY